MGGSKHHAQLLWLVHALQVVRDAHAGIANAHEMTGRALSPGHWVVPAATH
jgi:hypothetical protein